MPWRFLEQKKKNHSDYWQNTKNLKTLISIFGFSLQQNITSKKVYTALLPQKETWSTSELEFDFISWVLGPLGLPFFFSLFQSACQSNSVLLGTGRLYNFALKRLTLEGFLTHFICPTGKLSSSWGRKEIPTIKCGFI